MLSTFADSGLERAAALEKDIAWFKEEGLETPPLGSFGKAYAERLREIAAAGEWEVFVCHFYNFYFAHTAGGRMIGKVNTHPHPRPHPHPNPNPNPNPKADDIFTVRAISCLP